MCAAFCLFSFLTIFLFLSCRISFAILCVVFFVPRFVCFAFVYFCFFGFVAFSFDILFGVCCVFFQKMSWFSFIAQRFGEQFILKNCAINLFLPQLLWVILTFFFSVPRFVLRSFFSCLHFLFLVFYFGYRVLFAFLFAYCFVSCHIYFDNLLVAFFFTLVLHFVP